MRTPQFELARRAVSGLLDALWGLCFLQRELVAYQRQSISSSCVVIINIEIEHPSLSDLGGCVDDGFNSFPRSSIVPEYT